MKPGRTARLAYFVSHPIQYQAPLLRSIAQESDIELQVYFASDHSLGRFLDEGFGVKVEWDVPLLEGYRSEFLPRLPGRAGLGFARPLCYGIYDRIKQGGFDAVWVHGYSTVNTLRAILYASMLDVPVLLRTDSTLHDRARTSVKLLAKDLFFQVLRRHVRGVLATGKSNAAYWRHYLGEDVPIYAMPYAVDNAFFERKAVEAEAGTAALKQQLGLDAAVSCLPRNCRAASDAAICWTRGCACVRMAFRHASSSLVMEKNGRRLKRGLPNRSMLPMCAF